MDFGITKISTKGQIVIPYEIRKKMNLVKDENLVVFYENNEIILKSTKEILKTNRKKSANVEAFIKAMKHDKILSDMEKGKEISGEKALR